MTSQVGNCKCGHPFSLHSIHGPSRDECAAGECECTYYEPQVWYEADKPPAKPIDDIGEIKPPVPVDQLSPEVLARYLAEAAAAFTAWLPPGSRREHTAREIFYHGFVAACAVSEPVIEALTETLEAATDAIRACADREEKLGALVDGWLESASNDVYPAPSKHTYISCAEEVAHIFTREGKGDDGE